MSTSINILPDTLLKKIFSYLDMDELIQLVLPVSVRWSIVGSDDSLWRYLIFEGDKYSAESICSILHIASSLKSISLISVPETNNILAEICRSNTNVQQITVKNVLSHIDVNLMNELLTNCNDLEKINFKQTTFTISDNFYKHFLLLNNLRSLSFSVSNEHMSADKLVQILLNCNKIEELNLDNYDRTCPVLTDEIMPLILESLKATLKSLKLDCSNLGIYTYKIILKCSKLEILSLQNAVAFRSYELNNIPLKMRLKQFKISNPQSLRNENVIKCFQPKHLRLVNLHTIALTNFNYLEDSGLNAIISICGTNLIALNLNGCKRLSDRTILDVMKNCSNLKDFNIAFIPSTSNISFSENIPKFLPQLRTVIFDRSVNENDLIKLSTYLPGLVIKISENQFIKMYQKFTTVDTEPKFNYMIKLK